MRFNTVEIEHAYSDYLEFLEDWPPPEETESPAMERPRAEPDPRGEHGGTRDRPH